MSTTSTKSKSPLRLIKTFSKKVFASLKKTFARKKSSEEVSEPPKSKRIPDCPFSIFDQLTDSTFESYLSILRTAKDPTATPTLAQYHRFQANQVAIIERPPLHSAGVLTSFHTGHENVSYKAFTFVCDIQFILGALRQQYWTKQSSSQYGNGLTMTTTGSSKQVSRMVCSTSAVFLSHFDFATTTKAFWVFLSVCLTFIRAYFNTFGDFRRPLAFGSSLLSAKQSRTLYHTLAIAASRLSTSIAV